MPPCARVLIVTDQPVPSAEVLAAARERARRGPASFFVLVPNPASAEWHPFHPERHDAARAAERELLRALPAYQDAVDGAVRGDVSVRHDPMVAIEERLFKEPFDEILLAMAPVRHPHRHPDLGRRVAHLGLPVTVVVRTS